MKKLLLPLCLFLSISTGPVFAQDSTPAPTEVHDTTVNVNVPAQPEPAPAPAPDVNVHVDSPAVAPVVNTEKTTKESSVTKVIETPAAANDNTVLYIAGACIGILALGAIIVASKQR